MPPKKEQKKQIVAIFQPGLYWQYQSYPPQTIQKVSDFLTNFTNQLKALITPQQSFQDSFQIICNKMGTNPHPCLCAKKQVSNYPALKNNDYGEKFVVVLNTKLDLVTIKIVGWLMGVVKVNSVKFSNNALVEKEADQIKGIIEKQDQLTSVYFEWNPIQQHPRRQDIFIACLRPSLQHLILRQCNLGNQLAGILISKITQNAQSQIKSLDLYGNKLTSEIGDKLCLLVQQSKRLDFLGISKNQLGNDQLLTRLLGCIGDVAIDQQQFQAHKAKQKARDEIVQRNKKRKKGAPEQPVPFLFELKETPNGKFLVKNQSLRLLNIANNGIKDSSAQVIRKFVQGNGKTIQLFIEGNKFTKNTKQTLKFYENVVI